MGAGGRDTCVAAGCTGDPTQGGVVLEIVLLRVGAV